MSTVSFPRGVPTAVLNVIYPLLWLELAGYEGASRQMLSILTDRSKGALDYAAREGCERGLLLKVTVNGRTVFKVTSAVSRAAKEILKQGKEAKERKQQ